jgi:outer membrane lipoprotein SlyB
MNTPIDTLQPTQPSASSASKPLWAAVGILAAAVLAMGGAMIYQQRAPAPAPAPVPQVAALAPPPVQGPAASANAADDMIEKPEAVPAMPAPPPAKKVARPTPKPSPAPAPAPSYSAVAPSPAHAPVVAAAPLCRVCGSIESVTPVTRSTKPPGVGVGTVAGGVLGAVLGHQIGQGNGRTLGTIAGAVGGGFAGNAIEGRMRKETVYQVGVRMEDGSRRTLELAQAPPVGSRVTVEGSTIRANNGAVYRSPAAVAARSPQQAPVYQSPSAN